MSSKTSKSTIYTFQAVRCLFKTMGIATDDGNVLSLIKAAEAASAASTESEAIRTLAFAWDCCGVPQPGGNISRHSDAASSERRRKRTINNARQRDHQRVEYTTGHQPRHRGY